MKTLVSEGAIGSGCCDPNKLLKYAAYKYTVDQICTAEVKIFAALDFGCDLSFAKDDILGMIIVSVKHLQPYIMMTR